MVEHYKRGHAIETDRIGSQLKDCDREKSLIRSVGRFINSPIVVAIVGAVGLPLGTAVVSHLISGRYDTLLRAIPIFAWPIVLFLAVGLLVLWAIQRRLREINPDLGLPGVMVSRGGPRREYEAKFGDVLWRFTAPDSFGYDPKHIHWRELDIDATPHCPRCKTELSERKRFFGGYLWHCVGCGFEVRKSRSYFSEWSDAKKFIHGLWQHETRVAQD